jgi:RNA polymerase sigma-70 factor (ECF subfamily)
MIEQVRGYQQMASALDRQTVEELYRRYGAQVERRCQQFLPDPAEAADAAHEVFVKLITKGGEFRSDAEWMTWLYRVTTNVCLNRRRDSKRRRELLETHGSSLPRAVSSDPSVLSECSALLELLDDEDPTTQQVVVYHYLSGMTQHEIGDLIGMSRISVNKRLSKFKKRAQRRLGERKAA